MKNESKKILSKYDIVTGLFCLVGMIPGLIYYNRMPASIPIHFDINNQPNNYASKPFVVFVIPIIMLIFHLFCCAVSSKMDSGSNPKPVESMVRLIIPIITVVVEAATVMYVMQLFTDVGLICSVLIGILFIALGNYLPKTRPNRTFGVKLPWIMGNEDVWRRVHRLTGWMLVLGGIILITSAFLSVYYVGIAAIAIAVIMPVIYSLIISRKKA